MKQLERWKVFQRRKGSRANAWNGAQVDELGRLVLQIFVSFFLFFMQSELNDTHLVVDNPNLQKIAWD